MDEATKTIDGKARPAGDFLVVPDAEKPSEWALPVKVNGKVDRRLMGAAWAALHGGYRGNKYEGPDKAKALNKLKALYKSEGMDTPVGEYALSETAWVSVFGEMDDDAMGLGLAFIQLGMALLQGETGEPAQEDDTETIDTAEFSESAQFLRLSEVDTSDNGNRAPVEVDLKIISPGAGNKRDNHWYGAEMLKRDAHVFEGVDVYVTDHRENERSERTKVGKIKEIVGFDDDGGPIGRTIIFDPAQAEKTRNRAAASELGTLHCSILASGVAKKGEVDGKKYKIVERIDKADAVDLVSRAGAGGRALALAESENNGGEPMEDKQVMDEDNMTESEDEEQATFEEQAGPETTPDPEPLAQEVVHEALVATNLPPASVLKLAEAEYTDKAGLQEAVQAEIAEVKAQTGSGKPFAQGDSQPALKEPLTEEERTERFNRIMREVGAKEV